MGKLKGGCIQLLRKGSTSPGNLDSYYWARAATNAKCTNNDNDNRDNDTVVTAMATAVAPTTTTTTTATTTGMNSERCLEASNGDIRVPE